MSEVGQLVNAVSDTWNRTRPLISNLCWKDLDEKSMSQVQLKNTCDSTHLRKNKRG